MRIQINNFQGSLIFPKQIRFENGVTPLLAGRNNIINAIICKKSTGGEDIIITHNAMNIRATNK